MNDDMKLKMIENQKEIERRRKELKKIIYDDNNKKPKKVKKPIFTIFLLSLMFSLGVFFSVFLIIDSTNRVNQLYEIINAILVLFITLSIVISFSKALFKNKSGMTAFTSFLIIITMAFNGLYLFGIIKLPTQSHIIDYTGKSLSSFIYWADHNKVDYEESFEFSDKIKKYDIISQNVKANTLTKNIENIDLTVSNGPDYNKIVMLPDMTGLTSDDVIKFADENYLKNVQIVFEEDKDIKNNEIIKQSSTGKVKRNDALLFTASLGDLEKLSSIKLKNLKGKKLLDAEVYLGKNGIIYELKFEFDDKVKRGCVISSDIKPGKTLNPSDKIVLTISKGKKVKIPEFKNMSLKEVMNFIIKNNLDIEYSDKYDNSVKKGKVISSNYKKGDVTEEETVLNIVFSKGKLVMKSFKDLASFKVWAEKYGIKYEIKEEFNKDVPKDSIIKFSVKKGDQINTEEGVTVYVSKGEAIKVPDFIGKNKNDIQSECDSLGIICNFYNTLSDKPEGTAISQSIIKDTEISKGDSIDFEISTKKQEEVTVKKNKTNNTSNKVNNNISNSNSGNNNPTQNNQPSNNCNGQTYVVKGLNNVINNCNSFSSCKSDIEGYFSSNYPGVIISVSSDDGSSGSSSGSYVSGIGNGSTVECGKSYSIVLAK